MPLTDVTVRTAKPRDRSYKLADSGGLYLEVTPAGGKRWRWKYRIEGREKLLSMGVYPDVPLVAARARRDEARRLLASGIDPSVHRQAAKSATAESSANSFEVIAREWFVKYESGWAVSHSSKVIARLEKDVFPYIGPRPIAEVTAPELLKVLRRIEDRGALETAHKARVSCGQVLRYAVATARAARDISADLKGALPPVRTEVPIREGGRFRLPLCPFGSSKKSSSYADPDVGRRFDGKFGSRMVERAVRFKSLAGAR